MDLSQLYPRGTPMKEVHPNFRGMPYAEWSLKNICEQIRIQAKEWDGVFPIAAHTKVVRCMSPDAVWTEKGLVTPKASARERRQVATSEAPKIRAPKS